MTIIVKSEERQPSLPKIKPEPQDFRIASSSQNASIADTKPRIKNEPVVADTISSHPDQDQDVKMRDAQQDPPAPAVTFNLYESVDEIQYQPEAALKEGLGMVKSLRVNVNRLELGSKLRKDVWIRELESLRSQGTPSTMIAICGGEVPHSRDTVPMILNASSATGAGKSSILNAILDDNIVPTSGMRACTAVVTEIGYHNKKTVDADVSFLSEQEWRQELSVLLDDLVDEDGNIKRSTDLRSDAGVAWHKVHAVYPSVSQDQLVRMSLDQIIACDRKIAAMLGTTKHITAADSKTFGKEIAKYIDSKDQKRGDKKKDKEKKDKGKSKEKEQQSRGSALLAKFKKDHGKKKEKDDDADGPAFWPLIRQVNVRCNAAALSTGALLVDLPGVADANAARNNIAKDYMKKCDCIWILAPITRAVDDKTARGMCQCIDVYSKGMKIYGVTDLMGDAFKMQLMMDGNYDANAITFIATKCDDISCSEVIRALNLDDEPELEAIESEIYECKSEISENSKKKSEAAAAAKEIEEQLDHIRDIITEHEAHIEALEDGRPFIPTLTGKAKKGKGSGKRQSSVGQKRKRGRNGDRPQKRRRSGSDDDDDDFIDDGSDDSASDNGEGASSSDESDGSGSGSESENDGDEEIEEEEEATIDSVKAKIQEAKEAIKEARSQLNEFRRLKKEANDTLATLKKRESKAQREKNAFCSAKRSEFSRDVLKEDFRVGLKDLDDAAAEERDPDGFDPTVNIRDYEAIDLPVFTCSARDYVRIKGQVKGDGDPTCFSNVVDTGIPDLQKWCHSLTVSSRERAARNFLTQLKTFANSVKTYVQGIGEVTDLDREVLREKWESNLLDNEDEDDEDDPYAQFGGGWASSDIDMSGLNLHGLGGGRLYAIPRKVPKANSLNNATGITPRLIKDFQVIIDGCVSELQERFRDGLEDKCRVGAINAANAAVETSDNFAASMHWATYRATLRRMGSWRQDLNVELCNPFTRNIASSWSQVFEADMFSTFEKSTNNAITKLLKEVETDAPLGLKERARGQGELSLEEAKVALQKTLELVQNTVTTEQKEVSRCLAPHVQNQLEEGYNLAMEERGRGSVARQKSVFHNFVHSVKGVVFDDAADVIMGRLSKAAEAVGNALEEALAELAEKIEVSIAVLWEGTRDDPQQVNIREEVVSNTTQIVEQVMLWIQAAENMRQSQAMEVD